MSFSMLLWILVLPAGAAMMAALHHLSARHRARGTR
jgi:hypothetical protein